MFSYFYIIISTNHRYSLKSPLRIPKTSVKVCERSFFFKSDGNAFFTKSAHVVLTHEIPT